MQFNIADLFESVVDAVPERTALVCGERRLTYAELDARANRLAHALAARGVGKGDHIGLHLYNSTEFLEGMLAAFKLRAVPININYRYVDEELSYLYSNADLVAVIHQRELGGRVSNVAGAVPTLRTRIAVEDGSGADLAGAELFDDVMASGKAERGFAERSADDIYMIYTGGTTGMPRGVMWRHEDMFFAGLQGGNPGGAPLERPEQLAETVRSRSSAPTFLPAAPFIHGAAQWAALIGLYMGSKVVLVPGKSFDAIKACRLIEVEKVNTMTLVGDAMARPFVEALSAPGAKFDVSSLLVVASAGAILSESVKADINQRLPYTMVLNSFGATETGHQGTVFPGGPPGGRPKFFMDASNTVLGEDLKPLTPGSGVTGRLARRGRIPLGYYKDPVKTAATFVTIEGQRWALPGDLATVEADGMITVFGRGAVCINTGGEKIFPEEVEEALKAHPSVLDAVVVGVPDERWGQRVAALVQQRKDTGDPLTLGMLDAHCRTKIAGYKVPRQLRVVNLIVRHPSGKPDYRWARDTAMETP